MSIEIGAITAWGTIVTAFCSIVSVFVTYRAMQNQTKGLANSVSADLALKLEHEFESQKIIEIRGHVADALSKNLKTSEAEILFDFFEQIGFFVQKGIIDAEVAYSFFFHWVNLYWIAGESLIKEKRIASANLWTDFESLYKILLKIEKKADPLSKFIKPSADLIKQCLEEEFQ